MGAESFDIDMRLFVDAIYQKYQYDFRAYAADSLKRRLGLALSRFGCETLCRNSRLTLAVGVRRG